MKTSHIRLLVLSTTLCLAIQVIKAQPIKKYDRTDIQTFYINNKDSVIRLQAKSEYKLKKYESSLTYYWYKNNTILKTTGGGDGRLLCGDYLCFYPDNNLKEKGQFKKGLKNGTWTRWYQTGNMQEQIHWKNGIKHGAHIQYNSTGAVASTINYKNGKTSPKKEKPVAQPKDKLVQRNENRAKDDKKEERKLSPPKQKK